MVSKQPFALWGGKLNTVFKQERSLLPQSSYRRWSSACHRLPCDFSAAFMVGWGRLETTAFTEVSSWFAGKKQLLLSENSICQCNKGLDFIKKPVSVFRTFGELLWGSMLPLRREITPKIHMGTDSYCFIVSSDLGLPSTKMSCCAQTLPNSDGVNLGQYFSTLKIYIYSLTVSIKLGCQRSWYVGTCGI